MNFTLSSCKPSLSLHKARQLDVNFTDAFSLPERVSTVRLGERASQSSEILNSLLDYAVFPSHIMKHESEWKLQQRAMKVGDIIIQRIFIPPIGFGICVEAAVKICGIIEEPNRKGFCYETLNGHVEKGISEFYIERRSDGLYFTIRTFSEPAHRIFKMFKFLTLPYQSWCTQRALNHVKRKFVNGNSV